MQLQYTKSINNKSVLGIIRRFCNYIDPRLTEHGSHVSYIVFCMLRHKGTYKNQELRDICFAAQLHDIGAFKTEEFSRMLQFETNDIWNHSFYGYLFIHYFSPLKKLAPAILLHHIDWETLQNQKELDSDIRNLSQLIHVADRIDVFMSLEQRSWEEVCKILEAKRGSTFAPHIIDLALQLNFNDSIEDVWEKDQEYFDFLASIPLSSDEITEYLKMLVFIIDFRSHYTVTHTITTTSISYELGKLISLDQKRLNLVLCGALLHDLGKIAIPVEILENPGKLDEQTMDIMKTHVDLTEKIFGGNIDEPIARIALRHHEKLNGSGYPKGLTAKDLNTEERLVAIADIISALTGTRSYKGSFSNERILAILSQMKKDGLLDGGIIDVASSHLSEILKTTAIRCKPVLSIYEKLNLEYEYILTLQSNHEKIHFALSIKDSKQMPIWP